MVLSSPAVQVRICLPIPVLVKSYKMDKTCISSRKDKLPKPQLLRAFLFPLPLKVNFYAIPETNSVESVAEVPYVFFHPLFSISLDH